MRTQRFVSSFLKFSLLIVTMLIHVPAALVASAEETGPNFSRDVLPILADHCFACHGADEAAREADLRLDVRADAIDFGAIVENAPDESELIARIATDDGDLLMPPPASKKPLSEAQKETLRAWIASGAEYEEHWSFSPPQKPETPKASADQWGNNEIDHFVLAKLKELDLQPAAPAPPEILFRRLHLDITGLPPSPEDQRVFLQDYDKNAEAAIDQWIDTLMKRPGWGEHRARYWLDAARYADTHGLHFDNYREMWAYRDWVIRSFNNNQPFDEFTVDQLAGDLHDSPTRDQLIATGFQRCNITTNEGGTIAEENLANYAADRVQTFGWVYLGLTTNCCQCHDHKFDPLTMRDFYSLAAYFRNTTQGSHDGNSKDGRGPVIRVYSEEDEARIEEIEKALGSLNSQLVERRKSATEDFQRWLDDTPADSLAVPTDRLAIRFPLNEGTGNTVNGIAAKLNSRRSPPAVAIENNTINWTKEGVLGPAPVIKSNSVIDLGDLGDLTLDEPFTVAAWVRTASSKGSMPILGRMDESNEHRGWDLYRENKNVSIHLIDTWPNNAIKISTTSGPLQAKKWHHVAATYDGSRNPDGIKVYVDGVAQKTKKTTATLKKNADIHSDVPLKIGQRSSGGVFEGGSVQDLRIYTRELDQRDAHSLAVMSRIHEFLTIPSSERTEEQNKLLFDSFIASFDDVSMQWEVEKADYGEEKQAIVDRTPVTHVQKEKDDSSPMARILMRGAYDKPSDEVSATTPLALHALPGEAQPNRMGLAKWVIARENPLTARVTVNRFWQELFGQGIVATPEDFGVMGSPPSHPELLDWLAVEFQEHDWNVKWLFKTMLQSATYQQAATSNADKQERDRDNRYFSRGPRFRMDAEMVRDHALASSGLLSRKMYGPGTRPYQPDNLWNIVGLPGGDTRKYVQDKGENVYRRSIYTFWKRMSPPPNLETFNAPSREVCTVRRERTNTPLQALVVLNDPQFVEAARVLAESAIKASPGAEERFQFLGSQVLARPFETNELAILQESLDGLATFYAQNPGDAKSLTSVGDHPREDSTDDVELASWTMICNQLMNLDETLNK